MTKRNGKPQTLFAATGGYITATDLKLGNGFQIFVPLWRDTPPQLWHKSPPFASLVRMGRDYVAGKHTATIALELNVSVRTVRRLIERIGLERRKVGGNRPQRIVATSR